MDLEFKGTKGEWESVKNSCYFDVKTSNENNRDLCVNVLLMDECKSDSLSEECEANAKLIASAPEMFEELKTIFNNMDKGTDSYNRIEQLLTKITK